MTDLPCLVPVCKRYTGVAEAALCERCRKLIQASCAGKCRFRSELTARRNSIQTRRRTWARLDVYECGVCERWHVGHHVMPVVQRRIAAIAAALSDDARRALAAEWKPIEGSLR